MRGVAGIRGGKRNWVGGRRPGARGLERARAGGSREAEAERARHGGERETTWRGSTASETEELRERTTLPLFGREGGLI
jgi:hypothetical protein